MHGVRPSRVTALAILALGYVVLLVVPAEELVQRGRVDGREVSGRLGSEPVVELSGCVLVRVDRPALERPSMLVGGGAEVQLKLIDQSKPGILEALHSPYRPDCGYGCLGRRADAALLAAERVTCHVCWLLVLSR